MVEKGQRRHFDSLAVKLALGVTFLATALVVPGLFLAADRHYESQLALKRREVQAQAELLKLALEHQMLDRDPGLIDRMVQEYGHDPAVRRIMIFDRRGRLRFASDPAAFAQRHDRETSPSCQVCHAKPPAERNAAAVVELAEGRVIRTALPVRNRAACHGCHDPAHTVNGILIVDTSVEEDRARLEADVQGLVVGAIVLGGLLVVGIGLFVRRLILRPLARLAEGARAIGGGHFGRRVPAEGDGALADLGREFNAMAKSVASLTGQLKNQRNQLENLMNSVEDGLLVVDATYTIVAVNRSLARRLGVEQDALLFRRCCEIWDELSECHRDVGRQGCPAAEVLRTGSLHTAVRSRRERHTGVERQDEVFASPVCDEDGRVIQVVEVWRDITERKSREAKMAEFQRLASLGMLASGFSHEVNTPLATMLFCADELRRALRGDGGLGEVRRDEALDQVALIRGEVQRCRQITTQFLALSRGQSPSCVVMDVSDAIQAVVSIVAPTARDAAVTIEVVPGSDRPIALANDGAVQQVLLNLLLNAIQASGRGAVVRIGWAVDTAVRVWIRDEGPGVPPELTAVIFEPFFSRRPGGTGLGLFVSLNFARQWGGDITVSNGPEGSATFEVTFPLAGAPHEAAAAAEAAPGTRPGP